jgi:hypothetical protein
VQKERFERLVEVMARMASGDGAAVFTFHQEFGAIIGAVLRRHLGDMGVHRVQPEELNELIVDGCLALFDVAPAWDPTAGALPWNWAERRLRHLVAGHIGIHADSLDDGVIQLEDGVDEQVRPLGGDPEELDVLAGLAALDSHCALLREAFDREVSPRDRSLVLEVKVQASLGDPSPAVTVAERHGMRPDAVRQAVKRALDKLRDLARREERFAPLADLALLA